MKLYIDADACPVPVKEIMYKTSKRLEIPLILVANQFMRIPQSEFISSVIVSEGPDEADNYIVDEVVVGDLVVTADIPLADRVVKKGGYVIDTRGQLLSSDNIGERLASRNLMDELRSMGVETSGPSVYTAKDKQEFANQLNTFLTKYHK